MDMIKGMEKAVAAAGIGVLGLLMEFGMMVPDMMLDTLEVIAITAAVYMIPNSKKKKAS